ncbi:ketoacyl-ACP synthase III [Paenibacillus wulumuqiensis]|uniref:ketoacyl-ACP synthase III n=1 Tax=Paenibacillus wulumuqiensis TaxID=1567107 RepID=UPI000619617F|nr:ketoacyl-ACP synthase III [Paenibacillus wulumuqiensis]
MTLSTARITALGTYVPDQRITNTDLEQMVETSDEWIVQRTGIRERRASAPDQFSSDLSIAAVQNMLNNHPVTLDDVELILVATTTADYQFPSVATQVQSHFNITRAGALDINATCAGFVYALHMANSFITSGLHRKVLVIAAETMTKVVDYTDRNTCILFGDGAGAALVEYDAEMPSFIGTVTDSDGSGGCHVYRSGLSDQITGMTMTGQGKIYQNGREVYKWAVRTVPQGISRLLQQTNYTLDKIDWFVPHSANLKMIESISEKSGFMPNQALTSAEWFGNTSSASIPLAMQQGIQDNKLKAGDHLVLYGFGAGLTQMGMLIHWNPKS